jgi:rRNA maturation endonuclease Nob1
MTVRDYILRRARLGALAAMTGALAGVFLVRFAFPMAKQGERLVVSLSAIALFLAIRFSIAWMTRCPRCRLSLFRAALGLFNADRYLDRCPRCGLDFDEPMPR